jgi:hypothetical protein
MHKEFVFPSATDVRNTLYKGRVFYRDDVDISLGTKICQRGGETSVQSAGKKPGVLFGTAEDLQDIVPGVLQGTAQVRCQIAGTNHYDSHFVLPNLL